MSTTTYVRGISNEYPQHMILCRTGENYPILSPNTSPKQLLRWFGHSQFTFLDCGTLNNPANGQVNHIGGTTTVGSIAQFTCDTGYTVSIPSLITCQADGTWSNADPTCQINGRLL